MPTNGTWYECAVVPRKSLLVERCGARAVSLELFLDGGVIWGDAVANLVLTDEDALRLAADIVERVHACRHRRGCA